VRANARMSLLWTEAESFLGRDLPAELRELLDEGWVVGPATALLLKGQFGAGWRSDWKPANVARHEYEVNDVGVPSDGISPERDQFLPALVARARDFAVRALGAAGGMPAADLLTAVISVGIDDDYSTHGGTVRFFTRRGGSPRFYEDLERFRLEAMAVVDVHDLED
jgi:hypothetical protein